jgi:hypothetical protein
MRNTRDREKWRSTVSYLMVVLLCVAQMLLCRIYTCVPKLGNGLLVTLLVAKHNCVVTIRHTALLITRGIAIYLLMGGTPVSVRVCTE